jgi:hypothetical protein
MPDVTQASGLFLATVIGAAVGVVAGTLIQYFLTMALEYKSKARQKTTLMKELTYNRALIDELAEELQRLRNALNAGVLDRYAGYFAFNHAIFAQANAAAINGVIYELLSTDEVRRAQRIVSLLSVNNANWVNGEITKRKNILINTPAEFDRHEAVNFVNFIENQIRELGQWIDGLIQTLS